MGGGPLDRSCGHKKKNAASAKVEAQQGESRGNEYPCFSFYPLMPCLAIPLAMSKWQNSNSQGTRVKTNNNREILAQLIAERHIFSENVLGKRPCAKNFGHITF